MRGMKWLILIAIMAGLALVWGCSGDSSSDGDSGALSLSLTDATTNAYKAVYVTIEEVRVHTADPKADDDDEDGWKVVATPEKTYNLLELVNGVMADLGTTELESGHYTQMRLMLADSADDTQNLLGEAHAFPNYLIDNEDGIHELKVPSGYQTGIKLVHGFDIEKGVTAELVLDFDASRSVVKAGNSGNYLLKPTIKVVDTVDYAIVKGVITDTSEPPAPLADVIVSAQVHDGEAGDVRVFTSTRTGEDGAYQLYLPEDAYTIVAYKGYAATDTEAYGDAYGPACATLTAAYDTAHEKNFALAAAITGNIVVDLRTVGDDDMVTLSIREIGTCGESPIEVTVLAASGGGEYTIGVPGATEGTREYSVVATSDTTTRVKTAAVSAGADTAVSVDMRPQT